MKKKPKTRIVEEGNTFEIVIPAPPKPVKSKRDLEKDLDSFICAVEDFSNSPLDTKLDLIEVYIENFKKRIKEIRTSYYTLYPVERQTGRKHAKYLAEMEEEIQYARDRVKVGEEKMIELIKAQKPFKKSKTLPELFKGHRIFEQCVQILRDLKIVDVKNNFIGKYKGSLVVWIREMKLRDGSLIYDASNEIYAMALTRYFKNLTISGNMFAQPQKRAENAFADEFRYRIANIILT